MSMLPILILIVAMVGLMYYQSTRQRKAMRTVREMQDSLQPGDRIMTTSGMHATVVSLVGETAVLEIAPGIETEWDRRVIREKITAETPAEEIPAEETRPADGADDTGSRPAGTAE